MFIFTLCTQLQSLGHAVLPEYLPSQLLYGWLIDVLSAILGKSAFAYSFLAVLMIYLQALLLNMIVMKHRLFQQNTYLVAFAYVAICSLHPDLGQFSPMLIVNLLILFAINELLQLKQSHNVNKHIFNVGFLIMLAGLVQFSALFLIVFLMFALLILRPFNFREWMILLVGLVMPLYVFSVLLFCTDKMNLLYFWPDLGISLPSQLKPARYYLGVFSGIIIWLFISLYNMQVNLPKAPIYIRRCWIALTVLLFVALMAAIFSDSHIKGVWMICLIPLSLMMAHAFLNERSKKMNAISFYFALVLVLFCQIFLPI